MIEFPVSMSYKLTEGPSPLLADLRIRYEYDAYANRNDKHEIDANLEGQAASTFIGQNRGRNGLILGLGVGGNATEKLAITGGVAYAKRSNGKEASLGLNFTYIW